MMKQSRQSKLNADCQNHMTIVNLTLFGWGTWWHVLLVPNKVNVVCISRALSPIELCVRDCAHRLQVRCDCQVSLFSSVGDITQSPRSRSSYVDRRNVTNTISSWQKLCKLIILDFGASELVELSREAYEPARFRA